VAAAAAMMMMMAMIEYKFVKFVRNVTCHCDSLFFHLLSRHQAFKANISIGSIN
jgi:hypothetical protein